MAGRKRATEEAPAAEARAFLLWGPEEVRKKEALERLIEDRVPAADRELDVQYIDAGGQGITGEAILDACADRGMFSEVRVVVVLNAGRLRAPRFARAQAVLARGLARLPTFSTLILVAYAEESEERRTRNPFDEELMSALKRHAKILKFDLLGPDQIAALAAEEAGRLGKRFGPGVGEELARRCPDTRQIIQETAKLAAYCGDAPLIDRNAVEALVPTLPDENIFRMISATMAGNRREALSRLRVLRTAGVPPLQILTMLAREVRLAIQARALRDARIPPDAGRDRVPEALLSLLPEDQSLLSLPDWRRQRIARETARTGWPRLRAALDGLVYAEAGVKGWERGIEDPDLALECFIMRLTDEDLAASPGTR